ncbi:MAG: DNA-binding response regulator [Paenibacillus sp.]|jgi:two-component system OmpR family response regulator|nr:DNA-binding response regulator [Paenibacillus sp.]
MKLLIAEDDLSVCEMLRLFLQQEQIKAFFVHDGLEAERLIMEQAWDLILLDWMLPGKDGLTLCHDIRLRNNNVPVILLTAKDQEHDRILGLNTGADDYVIKPIQSS